MIFTFCVGCGNEIDREWCHCGERCDHHNLWYHGHLPVPMGCTCGYACTTCGGSGVIDEREGGIATSGVVPCPDCQPEIEDMTIDTVTLLQIEQGVQLVNCCYANDGSGNKRAYTFKLAPGEAPPNKGEFLLAARNPGGYALVEMIDVASDDFEPTGGVNYVWAIPLSTRTLDELQETDRKARKTIRLGAAIAEAKQGLGAMAERVTLLPDQATVVADEKTE